MSRKQDAAKELLRRRKARENFIDYCRYVYPNYESPKHIIELTDTLQKVYEGEIQNLIITMAPRFSKSTHASQLFPAWVLGKSPKEEFVQAGYSLTIARNQSRKARRIFTSKEHINIFPHSEITNKIKDDIKDSADEWETPDGGSYYAVGVSGGITGRGFTYGLIDDAIKGIKDANSQTILDGIEDWYNSDFYSRKQNEDSSIILISTRWCENDNIGNRLKKIKDGTDKDDWYILHQPAIITQPDGNKQSLWPEKFSLEYLYQLRENIGYRAFESLYMGNPTVAEGSIFKREWWKYYTDIPQTEYLIQSWDTAFQTNNQSDYSACTTWGINKSGYYLVDIFREKLEYPDLVKQVKILYEKYQPKKVLIENKASGQSLIQSLKRESRVPIIPVKPDSDKISRANAITGIIEAGKVYLPENHNRLYDFIEECSAFGSGGEHDDQVDSMVYALTELKTKNASPELLRSIPLSFGGIK